jgi:hypothetical protein
MRDPPGLRGIMCDPQNGKTRLHLSCDQHFDCCNGSSVESRCRFIEQQNLRPDQQGSNKREA